MPVTIRCPQCGKEYRLADDQSGLRVRCRQCKEQFDVPAQPERLEAVSTGRPAGRPLTVEEDRTLEQALKRQKPANRRWLVIAAGLTAVLLVLLLACGGTLMMLLSQSQRAAQVAAAELARAQEEARRNQEARDRAEKEKRDRDAAEREKLADAQRRIAELEQKGRVVRQPNIDLNKLDLSKLDLNNLDGLMGQLTPEQREALKGMLAKLKTVTNPVKDIDDALKKLTSANRDDRTAALEYIKVAMPPNDGEKRKAVSAALNRIISEETDESLVESAKTAKLLWEN